MMFQADQRVLIIDNVGGNYVPIAISLSKYFRSVSYHAINQSPYPLLTNDVIGVGYKEIQVLDELWNRLDEFDLFILCDSYLNDYGDRLRKLGKLVFGGTEAEQLESDRFLFNDELQSVGLPTIPSKKIQGITNLINYLKGVEDKWIKISFYRGIGETWHHINYNLSKIILDEYVADLGPTGEMVEFLVQDNLESIGEIGSDGWTVNGKFPSKAIWGLEVKDCGYVCKTDSYGLMPSPIRITNDKFGPILQKYNHTGFFSTEIRYTEDGKSYFTDACVRAGSPSSNCMMELISNWDKILPAAANGQVVDPIFKAKYAVEIILKSSQCTHGYLPISFPAEYKDNIKLKGSFIIDGNYYVIPFNKSGYDMTEFGSVVVIGDNLQKIMNEALEIASSINGIDICYNADALNQAMKSIHQVEQNLNIQF